MLSSTVILQGVTPQREEKQNRQGLSFKKIIVDPCKNKLKIQNYIKVKA